jgi:hypothetical protein
MKAKGYYMENHPIPQDVTGFQFKLIGSMTLKQFGYVGFGVIMAVVLYYAPIAWYLKALFIPTFAISGICLAFVPLDGRPLDVMALKFFMALVKPDQFVYKKIGGTLSFMELNLQPVTLLTASAQSNPNSNSTRHSRQNPESDIKKEQLLTYLYDTKDEPVDPLEEKEKQLIQALFSHTPPVQQVRLPADEAIKQTAAVPVPPRPDPAHTNQNQSISPMPGDNGYAFQQVRQTHQTVQPTAAMRQIDQIKTPPPAAAAPEQHFQASATPTFVQIVQPENRVQPQPQTATGMDFPNLIKGIVKDPRGNILPGVLVEVKNKDGESVRAFKTNIIGQFASATQLANGTYTLVFEDPKGKHKFDEMQVETNGTVLAPLTIVSIDEREELRRSLFG